MLALLVVMIAITIMLAPTVKIFFEKRAEIAALQADIAAKQSQQDDLRRQVSRWQDPNYVKQQARDRINMVMPGETGYWVFGSDLPAGSSGGAGRCRISPRPGRAALGGLPLGIHPALGNRLSSGARRRIVRRTNQTGQEGAAHGREPSGRDPHVSGPEHRDPGHPGSLAPGDPAGLRPATSMSSAGSWGARCATSSRSRPAASAATRWWRPPPRG